MQQINNFPVKILVFAPRFLKKANFSPKIFMMVNFLAKAFEKMDFRKENNTWSNSNWDQGFDEVPSIKYYPKLWVSETFCLELPSGSKFGARDGQKFGMPEKLMILRVQYEPYIEHNWLTFFWQSERRSSRKAHNSTHVIRKQVRNFYPFCRWIIRIYDPWSTKSPFNIHVFVNSGVVYPCLDVILKLRKASVEISSNMKA